MATQLVIDVVIRNQTRSHEIGDFPRLFQGMVRRVMPWVMVLDKGYDAEWVHQMIRNQGIRFVIPVRKKSHRVGRVQGKYRKEMWRKFDDSLYHQRNKCETIFTVIKRRFGSEVSSYNDSMKERELLCRVLAYNFLSQFLTS